MMMKKDGFCFMTHSGVPVLGERTVREILDWEEEYHVAKWGHRTIFAYGLNLTYLWIDVLLQECGCIYDFNNKEVCDCMKEDEEKVLGLPDYDTGRRGAAKNVIGYFLNDRFVGREEFIAGVLAAKPELEKKLIEKRLEDLKQGGVK